MNKAIDYVKGGTIEHLENDPNVLHITTFYQWFNLKAP